MANNFLGGKYNRMTYSMSVSNHILHWLLLVKSSISVFIQFLLDCFRSQGLLLSGTSEKKLSSVIGAGVAALVSFIGALFPGGSLAKLVHGSQGDSIGIFHIVTWV
jgi:hypothetical protein